MNYLRIFIIVGAICLSGCEKKQNLPHIKEIQIQFPSTLLAGSCVPMYFKVLLSEPTISESTLTLNFAFFSGQKIKASIFRSPVCNEADRIDSVISNEFQNTPIYIRFSSSGKVTSKITQPDGNEIKTIYAAEVLPGPPSVLQFISTPIEVFPFESFSVEVEVQDSYGNRVKNTEHTVSLHVQVEDSVSLKSLPLPRLKKVIKAALRQGKTPSWLKDFFLTKTPIDDYVKTLFKQETFPPDLLPIIDLVAFPEGSVSELSKLIEEHGILDEVFESKETVSISTESGRAHFRSLTALPSTQPNLLIIAAAKGLQSARASIPEKAEPSRPIKIILNGNTHRAVYFYPNRLVMNGQLYPIEFLNSNRLMMKGKLLSYRLKSHNQVIVNLIQDTNESNPLELERRILKNKQLRTKH